MNEIKILKKKVFCCNCGKYGHKYSNCNDPITSLGIIAIKLTDDDDYNNFINYFKNDYIFNFTKTNSINNNILLNIKKYKDKFKFLFIRRKKTLGYIEFIRGRYNVLQSNTYKILFHQMVLDEINEIVNNDFDTLWNNMWNNNNKNYKNEFSDSKLKFDELKNNLEFKKFIIKIKLEYKNPEWGIPKGRRIFLEKNIRCACREFEEETSLQSDDYKLLNNIPAISEIFYGTDNILYKHIYYFALCKNDIDVKIDVNNKSQMEEVGDIGWFNYEECIKLIRPYHNKKKDIINDTLIFFSSIIDNNFCVNNKIVLKKI